MEFSVISESNQIQMKIYYFSKHTTVVLNTLIDFFCDTYLNENFSVFCTKASAKIKEPKNTSLF